MNNEVSTLNNNSVLKERTMSQDKNYFSSKQQQLMNNNKSFYEKQSRLETEEDLKNNTSQKNVENSSYLA